MQQFARAVQIEKEGTRGAEFDFTTEGWIADYADPYDFINVLLSGDSLHDANNNNVAYYNSPKFNKAMTAASNLSGSARYAAYQALDKNITTQDPAWAARSNFNSRIFVSGAHRWLRVPAGVLDGLRDGVHQVTNDRNQHQGWGPAQAGPHLYDRHVPRSNQPNSHPSATSPLR